MSNDKRRGRLRIDKNKAEELRGFEDVIDIILDEEEQKERAQTQKEIERYGDTYELYNYLESERERLEKINQFFSLKVANMQEYSQTAYLLAHQKDVRNRGRKELIEELKRENSLFIKQLNILFSKSFKKYSKS